MFIKRMEWWRKLRVHHLKLMLKLI